MKRYPLKLNGIRKDAIWGGSSLLRNWGVTHTGPTLAELWTLSVRSDATCEILNGEASGTSLDAYLSALGEPATDFPLLVKLIDAGANLSVQVHPNDEDALKVGETNGKTEMWYVLEAEEGAKLYLGTKPGVTREAFLEAMDRGAELEAMLEPVSVHPGDLCWIPAGTVHAIGAGLLVAEVQQNSDVTYRLYDYGRLGQDGKPRPLHKEQAAKVLRLTTPEEREATRLTRQMKTDPCVTPLVACEYFFASLLRVEKEYFLRMPKNSFLSLLCVEGAGEISCDGETYPVAKGDSYFLPKGCPDCTITGNCSILVSGV